MTSKFNKKKIKLFPSSKNIKYLFFIFFFFASTILIINELRKTNRLYNIVQNTSEKFNYLFLNLEINSLNRVQKSQVLDITNQYYKQSIFLIPLDDISKSLHELSWVKNVNLSSNFKNKINVEIFEYSPIGLFHYNKQLFYFSNEGKIIDKYIDNINENLIVFHGKEVLKHANNFLTSLNKIDSLNMIIVKKAYFINKRRWDLLLDNEITLNLSEKNIEGSIVNYIKLIDKFNKNEINSIKNIDLRNNEKAIISFK